MGRHMIAETQDLIWDRYEAGDSIAVIARTVGRPYTTVREYLARYGHRRSNHEWYQEPAESTFRLTTAEREEISRGLVAGESFRQIARQLGRAPSTISREVNANGGRVWYRAIDGEERAKVTCRRPKAPKLTANQQLRQVVEDKLGLLWSPEQIAGWLKLHHPDDESMQVCHETIYQSLYASCHGVLRRDLRLCLRTKRARRRPRGGPSSRKGRGVISDQVLISERPAEVDTRQSPGHWEGDLVVGNKITAVATLVERKTRFTMIAGLDGGRTADKLNHAVAVSLGPLAPELRQTLTWDQGKEIAGHRDLTNDTGIKVYLCNPKSPWQRGTNENTNGLIRQYFPRSTNFYAIDQTEFDRVADALNNRPRKTLGWRTPQQAINDLEFDPVLR